MNAENQAEWLAIRREELTSPHARRLIEALNAELSAIYPEPGATHFRLDSEEVSGSNGVFLIGYIAAEPVACGAIRRIDADVAELKRMYVKPSERGCGISRVMLTVLETNARELGVRQIVLETGPRQSEAIGLYRSAGYLDIPRFGEYMNSDISLCMGKDLD